MKQFETGTPRVIAAMLLVPITAASAQPVGRDFNNDGTLDYPVSITEYNETTLPKGAARLWSGASKQAIQTIVASDPNTLFGFSIESAGDIDGDGFDDVVVGEPLWGTPDAWEGRVHVFSGQDGSNLMTVTGPYPEIGLGRYVTGVGDWNGDGTNDIAASGWITVDLFASGSTDDGFGVVFIFSGLDGSALAEITDVSATHGFGYGLFPLGDINSDGRSDLAVTDPIAAGLSGTSASGAIYIFHGLGPSNQVLDFSDTASTILNGDPTLRLYGAQIDSMHPNRWMSNQATMQVLSLTDTDNEGGVCSSEFIAEVVAADGTLAGNKGTRSQLIDPGDIDINGVVDADDVVASVGQYGTSPNASGVMPVADINKDGLVDDIDIATVLQGFGASSNIFEDLWRDDRLRSIAGGSAGFGSRPNGSNISPAGGFSAHPIDDDCIQQNAGPSGSLSAIPYLLGLELGINCARCPSCGAPDSEDCYECEDVGRLSGGEIDIDKRQPMPGETVTIDISRLELRGGKNKCVPSCGADGRECPRSTGDYWPWRLEKWVNDEWQEVSPRPSTTDIAGNKKRFQWSGEACTRWRVVVELTIHAPSPPDQGNCEDEEFYRDIEFEFANFKLESQTLLPWADDCDLTFNSNTASHQAFRRTTIGLREKVKIQSESGDVIDAYDASGPGNPLISSPPGRRSVTLTAGTKPGVNRVTVTINDCTRTIDFNVIEPDSIEFQGFAESHADGTPNAIAFGCYQLKPTTVCFDALRMREGTSQLPSISGEFSQWVNCAPNAPGINYYYSRHDTWTWQNVNRKNYIQRADAASAYLSGPAPCNPQGYQFGRAEILGIEIEYRVDNQPAVLFDYADSVAEINSSGSMRINKTARQGGTLYQTQWFPINTGNPYTPYSACPNANCP